MQSARARCSRIGIPLERCTAFSPTPYIMEGLKEIGSYQYIIFKICIAALLQFIS